MASYYSALLGSSSQAILQGLLTRESEGRRGVAAQARSQLPARFSLSDVWTEGGEQWGLKRSLYSGRKTAFSVHFLLEERPGWYVFHNTVQLDTSWAGWSHDFLCVF